MSAPPDPNPHDPRGAAPTAGPPTTRGQALALGHAAVEGLAALGESVEDEWTYVTALADAGRARLRAAADDAAAALAPDRAAAVAAVCAEAASIVDPHRAIDWLSTLPAVIELALGPGQSQGPPGPGPSAGTPPTAGAAGAGA